MSHTPGPWLAAARPSSVVGLPVVATSNGRSIASVTFFHLGEAFAAHDRESRANARLIAAAPELLEALRPFAHARANSGSSLTVVDFDRALAAVVRAQYPERDIPAPEAPDQAGNDPSGK